MKKALCLLMATLTLLATISCANTSDDSNHANSKGTSVLDTKPVTEEETEDQRYVCDLPEDLKLGGDDVTILYANVTSRRDEMMVDEAGGIVSDAVYARNVAVEERLDFKMDLVTSDDIISSLKKDFNGGTGAYDIITCSTKASIIPAMQGYYVDLSRLEYIDTSKHYWIQGYNDMVTFTDANMQFLASGSMTLSMYRLMYFTLYNKELYEDYHIQDLYDVVMNGEWTLDYQYSIIKDKYVEKDGDDKPTKNDFYGFVTGNTISVDPYMVAADIHLVTKDSDTGMLRYNTAALDDLVALCDKVQKLYNDKSTYAYKGANEDDVPKTYIIDHFNAERALMVTTIFLQMERQFDALTRLSYGIAPIPKFSQEQENYGSYVQDQVSSFGITAAVTDTARRNHLAAILEAIAYYSHSTVRPAYYETALTERYMQDPQSSEILDLMFNSLQFDFSSSCSNIFTSCVMRDNLRFLLSGKANTIASSTKNWERSINNTLEQKYNPKLEELKPID